MQRTSADLELKHERSIRAALDKQRPDTPRRTSSKSRDTSAKSKSTSVSKSKSRSRTSKRDKLTDSELSSGSGDSADELQAQLQAAQVEIAGLRKAATAAVVAATGSKKATARKRVFREGARGGRGRARSGGRGRCAAPMVEDLVEEEEAEDEEEEDRSWVYPVTTTPADVNEKFKSVPGIKRLEDVLRALNELPAGWDDT
ncbi:hypothetical protein CYMTET_9184 [Cymbomonas tetramitiformis]|uniref:Uncharacterized protein n=1 Tax=Cymbomonas tetramitiformis TaxID=36881 RepID=A0AAE0GS68_9CHLO|nr:hypothetical protein CYMTET_9184 [Cymbomonas tetramitiformis]